MAFLVKRPQTGDAIRFYTLGKNKTVLLVGLGNIGSEYDGTRHNAGFLCLDHFVKKTDGMSDWINKTDQKCYQSTGRVGEVRVIAIKPTTLMNLSGEAVQLVSNFYKIHPQDIVLIHDELDIDFGLIRTRSGGSAAGHNGVKSVIQHSGEDTGRIRIGIGPKHPEQIDSADFVLGKFDKKEAAQLPNMQQEVTAILSEYLYGGQLMTDTRSFIV
ncbi:MAG TPA: aminoacyl-tRNA hydrolase [Candidatus Saccharimonadales bacterium]|nr:aminoacyl-tRNA hydrolase [Candidatus Saccharimonadales bacterium]